MAMGGAVDILATEDPDAVQAEQEEMQVYEKHNNLLHGSRRHRYTHTHTHSYTHRYTHSYAGTHTSHA